MAADSGGRRVVTSQLRFGLLAFTAFAGAFSLFVVQPMLAKWLLPALGGSPATWVSCMLFFQVLLLAGYAAAQLATRSPIVRGGYLLLAAAALAVIAWNRVLPLAAATPATAEAFEHTPVRELLWVLVQRAGLPYLLLATVAPLVQHWTVGLAERSVIRLYAVSNAGSLASLLAYPIWIEPALRLPAQWTAWSVAAGLVCVLMAWLALTAPRERAAVAAEPLPDASSPKLALRARWVLYAFVPSVFLLATTSYLTTDIAAVPLLWVVPLALYLATFIAAFGGAGDRAYGVAVGVFVVASIGGGWNAFAQGSAPLWAQLAASLAAFSCGAFACHMELVRTRPSFAHLPEFYVWIAVGGALGGFFVAVLAPLVFNDYYELELSVLATYLALLARRGSSNAQPRTSDALEAGRPRRSGLRSLTWLGVSICLPVLGTSLWIRAHGAGREGRVLEQRRSFLGSVRVTQLDVGRTLTHGRIRHGMQLDAPALRRLPTMYFGQGTAIARVFERHHAGQPRSIGVVGLGAGTLAAYGGARDHIRFYELDAEVIEVASRWFTFLADSPARIETVLGDGRLRLQRETERFDILVLDAFTSDAVPVHLLTLEAFRLYSARLAPDGVLLMNVSNRHLAVDRVVRGAAEAQGFACAVIDTPADPQRFVSKVRWAVIARQREQLSRLIEGMNPAHDPLPVELWTDVHASLWPVLR